MNAKAQGFTLVELVVVVAVLGLVSIMLIPTINSFVSAQALAYAEAQKMKNQLLGQALMTYAEIDPNGRLPAPYTGAGYTKTVYDPATADANLKKVLMDTGVGTSEINDDGTTAAKVRVYQLVQGITQQVPLYAQSGALVTLTYDYGVLYMSDCQKATSTCNPTPATGVPGASQALSGSNYTTWTTTPPDSPAYYINSLTVQRQMLATTVQRLDRVRDMLLGFLRGRQITAPGNDTTNWYPNQTGASEAGSMSGKNPVTTQGCRDGWYDLSSPAVNVLPQVGLAREEYGLTAWGGKIEYCRDYDALGTSAANAPPHSAAVRMLANVSGGGAPDAAVAGNNVIITF